MQRNTRRAESPAPSLRNQPRRLSEPGARATGDSAPRWRLGLGVHTALQVGMAAVPNYECIKLHCSHSSGAHAAHSAKPAGWSACDSKSTAGLCASASSAGLRAAVTSAPARFPDHRQPATAKSEQACIGGISAVAVSGVSSMPDSCVGDAFQLRSPAARTPQRIPSDVAYRDAPRKPWRGEMNPERRPQIPLRL